MPQHEPQRRCILTGAGASRGEFIRLALSPDGVVLPDIGARAPGRGAWITPDKALIAAAETNSKLKGALMRAFKGDVKSVPTGLADLIEAGLKRAALDRLGLALRTGQLVCGHERVAAAIEANACLVLHAADAAPDGVRKLEQRLHSHSRGLTALMLPIGRDELSLALGQANVVHAALRDKQGAARVAAAILRWRDYLGGGDDNNTNTAAAAFAMNEG